VSGILIPEKLLDRHSPQDADDRSAAAREIGAAWAERFIDLAGLKATDRVLDIGCGPGRMAIAIGEKLGWSNQYFGFDIFKRDIKFARKAIAKRYRSFTFEHLDIRNEHYNPKGRIAADSVKFPVSQNFFDFAFATSVFTHFTENDIRNYVRETYSALRPGGTFLATYFLVPRDYDTTPPNPRARFRLEHKIASHVRILYRNDPLKAVGYDVDWVSALYGQAGFFDLRIIHGAWNCAPGAVSSQDILIARKPG
jgi:SAM-dependent methyltransferase